MNGLGKSAATGGVTNSRSRHGIQHRWPKANSYEQKEYIIGTAVLYSKEGDVFNLKGGREETSMLRE